MIEQGELLIEIAKRLRALGIPYMVTGSYGSAFNGQPRSTNDIDIVILPTESQLDQLTESLGERFYVSRETAHSALRRKSMFNIIDTLSGWKIDLIVRKSRPFSISEFERRRTTVFANEPIDVISAEDSILSKLEWARKGESDRQLRDVEAVAVVQWPQLDFAYLRKWAADLGVIDELERTLKRAAMVVGTESPPISEE